MSTHPDDLLSVDADLYYVDGLIKARWPRSRASRAPKCRACSHALVPPELCRSQSASMTLSIVNWRTTRVDPLA